MQKYYSSRAGEYDAVYGKPERQSDLRAIERWLPPLFSGARVLEIACGTGYWTQFIAPAAASIVAIDAAPETLRIARERVPARSVQFLAGDAYDISRSAPAFDAAFAGFWFSHIPKARRREFLIGLNAALRLGARVVFVDNRYVEGSSSPVTGNDTDGNTYQTRRLGNGSTHRILKNFPSEAELQDAVAGFAAGTAFSSWQHYWAFEYRVAAP
jgi:demethylmenaquinone methyltransferase/2-methoxy-6-polyprenyl-1,4-benzoquinol methylase